MYACIQLYYVRIYQSHYEKNWIYTYALQEHIYSTYSLLYVIHIHAILNMKEIKSGKIWCLELCVSNVHMVIIFTIYSTAHL